MMDNKEDIIKRLSKSGLKCTRQRMNVINVMLESDMPMTADMIFSKTDKVSLSTVYRILEKFMELGIVTRENFLGTTETYYEIAAMKHRHYAICLGCHEMRYIDTCPVHDTKINNFTVTGHRLELFGYCDKCAQNGQRGN